MDCIINLENTKLVYVAEGNANIVLKLPDYKHVLRLPKTESSNDVNDGALEVFAYLWKCRKYMEILMKLVGDKYIYLPSPIKITNNVVKKLNDFATPLRPKKRLNKVFNGKYGLLMLDATMGLPSETTYSVEIKPKQGWSFDETTKGLFDASCRKMCRYCCMQYLKLKQGKISTRSKYCPMDLFSGNLQRMQTAFDSLLDEPQNNLRIFKNGELIYDESGKHSLDVLFNELSKSDLYSLLAECLLNTVVTEKISANDSTSQFQPCDTKSSLPICSILKKILDLQDLAKRNMPYMSQHQFIDDKSYNALESLVLKKPTEDLMELSPEEQYMIGATLMDASLMITFHECNSEITSSCGGIRVVSGKRYYTKVTLLDLDPKPDNHFKKYLKQTNEAFKAAQESVQ